MMIENSAKAIIIHNNKLLLIRNNNKYGNWYCLPGGRQNFGEDLKTTLKRECREEIKVEPTIKSLLFVREYIHSNHEFCENGDDMHKIEFMFLCKLMENEYYKIKDGSCTDADQEEIVWIELSEVKNIKLYPHKLNEMEQIIKNLQKDDVYWGDII